MSITRKCKIDGCMRLTHGRGLCKTHWQKLRRYGDPLKTTAKTPRPPIIEGDIVKIPLGVNAKDGYAVVDIDNLYIAEMFWHKDASGYPSTRLKTTGKLIRMHNILTNQKFVDHIDVDKLNNRIKNLRSSTPSDNNRNKKLYKHNTSGYNGVARYRGKWKAQISYLRKNVSLGVYHDLADAIGVRMTAECMLWGYLSPSWNIIDTQIPEGWQ